MKTRMSRAWVLLLALAFLLAAFAGCGGQAQQSIGGAQPSQAAQSQAEQDDGPTPLTEIPLPISEEGITLRVWFQLPTASRGNMNDYNDSETFQELEKLTNIHIDWIHPVEGTEQESFNLLFSSGDLPDIIQNYNTPAGEFGYQAGPDAVVADGYYLDLTELANIYCPNYMSVINGNEAYQRDSVTDSGTRWCFYWIYQSEGRKANYGPAIRQDFLDDVGLDVPVTYDDWHTVLTAFKNELGLEIPLYIGRDGMTRAGDFLAGFGAYNSFFHEEETVKYGPYDEGFHEYLDTMKQWYAEGLIDANFTIRADKESPDDELVLNDKIGAFTTFATWCGDQYYPSRGAQNPDFNLVGATLPVQKKGDTTHVRQRDTKFIGPSYSVSASTKYPAEALQWVDVQYSPDVSFMQCFGVRPDESYVQKEDGTYMWGPLITDNPDGMTQNEARTKYTILLSPYDNSDRITGAWNETQVAATELWSSPASKDDWLMPTTMSMTVDEGKQVNNVIGDITTFVEEYTIKYIMGNDVSSFEDYRAQLEAMGIKDAIAAYQAAFDRYGQR